MFLGQICSCWNSSVKDTRVSSAAWLTYLFYYILWFDTLTPEQIWPLMTDNIFTNIFLKESWNFLFKLHWSLFLRVQLANIALFIVGKACSLLSDKSLVKLMRMTTVHTCITGGQWVEHGVIVSLGVYLVLWGRYNLVPWSVMKTGHFWRFMERKKQ